MTEVEIASFDGVRIRAYHSPLTAGQEHLIVVLPLAATPSFIAEAVKILARHYVVFTWEARLILRPEDCLSSLEALSIEAHVKDVDALAGHFGISRASLIGYCSGAAAALHIAAANQDRYQKLALINGAYFVQPHECELTQYERDVLALMPQIAVDHGRASWVFEKFFAGDAALRRRNHEFAAEFYRPYENVESFYRFGVCVDHLIRSDSKRIARAVKIPTLVACGRLDDRTHWSSSMLVASQMGVSETYIDETGDHYEFCRAEPSLMGRLEAFLSQA